MLNDKNQEMPDHSTTDATALAHQPDQHYQAGANSSEEYEEQRCQLINELLDREEATFAANMESKSLLIESSFTTNKGEQRVSSKLSPESGTGTAQLGRAHRDPPQTDDAPGAWSIVGTERDQVGDDDDENDDDEVVTQEKEQVVVPEASVVLTELESIQICMAACDGCKGWDACKDLCLPDATFSCQADTLSHIRTVKEYANFFQAFGYACPGASWTTHNTQWCTQTNTATLVCTYHCTHSKSFVGVGPITPTHKTSHTDYIYNVQTDPSQGYKIKHITKIWNDKWCLRDLGWLPEDDKSSSSSSSDAPATDTNAPVAVAAELGGSLGFFAGDASVDHSSALLSCACSSEVTALSVVKAVQSINNDRRKAKKKKSTQKSLKEKLRKLLGFKSNNAL